MHARAPILLFCLSLVVIPVLSQVEPSATGGGSSEDDTQMMTPPPVSGTPYASGGSEGARSNYLSASIGAQAGYIDNILPGYNSVAVSDEIYGINPSVSLSRSTPRQTITVGYDPNFTIYQHTSGFNTFNQSASLAFSQGVTPHIKFNVENFFIRTNNVFTGAYPFSSGGVTGSGQAPIQALIVPFAEQMSETVSGSINYQFSLNGMIGGSGSYSTLNYPNSSQAVGVYNSTGEGGSAFYSNRFSLSQYAGFSYSYSNYSSQIVSPTSFQSKAQTISGFYTHYFNTQFSFSLSGGAQYISEIVTGTPAYNTWAPSGVASIGWQGKRASISGSYSHTVTSGEGLYGAFYSDSESASAGWSISPRWTASFGVSYMNISPLTSSFGGASQFFGQYGGNTLAASASLGHTLTEHLTAHFGYDHLHESYPGISVISANPDSDQIFGSISYEFRKPLGR